MAIHKKVKKIEPKKYRLLSLLLVLGKTLETTIVGSLIASFDLHCLISSR